MNQLKATDKLLKTKTPLLKYQLFLPQLDWNLFWPPQLPQPLVHKSLSQHVSTLQNEHAHELSQDETFKQRQSIEAQTHDRIHYKQQRVNSQVFQQQREHKLLQ